VDGVGGDDGVDAALEHRGLQHLLERLQALLVLEEAQQPQGDARVALVLLERDAQELRTRVDDQHADLALEDAQAQAIEQDARAARVVHQDLAVLQVTGERLDGGVEIVVPAVLLDLVVGQPGLVDLGVGPRLVGHLHEALRPRERIGVVRALGARDRARDRAVQLEQAIDEHRAPAAPATVGRCTEPVDEPARRADPPLRALRPIPGVHHAEVELGLLVQLEFG